MATTPQARPIPAAKVSTPPYTCSVTVQRPTDTAPESVPAASSVGWTYEAAVAYCRAAPGLPPGSEIVITVKTPGA